MSEATSPATMDGPARLPLVRLSSLWFQVTGLLCNLECTHCLVDSSPQNKSMAVVPIANSQACRGRHMWRLQPPSFSSKTSIR